MTRRFTDHSSQTKLTPLHIFFFFNDTATTEIYTLSLHDALPISSLMRSQNSRTRWNAPPGGAVEDTPGLGEAPLMGIIGRRADYKTFRMLLQNGGLPGPLRLLISH